MGRITKRQEAADAYRQLAGRLQCPICGEPLVMDAQTALLCAQMHSFDLAKNGVVQLVRGPIRPQSYQRELFDHRLKIMEAGFFDPILEQVLQQLIDYIELEEPGLVIDAGCGSGSQFQWLQDRWSRSQTTGLQPYWIGIDLSKDAVHTAAKMHRGPLWITADLNNMPIADGSCDAIMNILSPGSYREFSRVLKPGGGVLKVIPQSGYLQELRKFIPGIEEYSNDLVVRRFAESLQVVRKIPIRYQWALNEQQAFHLVAMTPLAWNQDLLTLAEQFHQQYSTVTVEVLLLIGETGGSN